MTFLQPSTGNSSSFAPQLAPALLTRMSSDSHLSATAVASASQPSGVDRSAGIASHGPRAASWAAAAVTCSTLRAEMITRQPASSSPPAIM